MHPTALMVKLNSIHGPITELRLHRDEGALYDYEEKQANDILGTNFNMLTIRFKNAQPDVCVKRALKND